MRKLALALIFLLFSGSAFAEFGRSTTFDDREICEKEKGVWHEFGNSAADNCESKMDSFAITAQVLTYACDCGKTKCWDGEKCVAMQDFKKIYDQKQAAEKKKLEEAKKARQGEYRDNSNERLQALIKVNKDGTSGTGNNLSQFSDKFSTDDVPASNDAITATVNQQTQTILDQSKKAAEEAKKSGLGQFFSLPALAENSANKAQVATPSSDNSSAGPTPFFLQQQEKAKQEVSATSATTSTETNPAVSTLPTLPGLPQIPLPQ